MMWYEWFAVLIIGLCWIEHYMDWKLKIAQETKTEGPP